MQNAKTPTKILVFVESALVGDFWNFIKNQQELDEVHIFHSWEDFETRGNRSLVEDAVVFMNDAFTSPVSRYEGTEMAARLRELGARKIHSTNGRPGSRGGDRVLFDSFLDRKFPLDVRSLF